MKQIVFIVLVASLSSIVVEGFSIGKHHKNHGPPRHGPPHHSDHFYDWPNHKHFQPYREENKPSRYDSNESNDSSSGSNSGPDNDSSSSDENQWHRPGRRPCWGWRCSPERRTTKTPCWHKTSTLKTTAWWLTMIPSTNELSSRLPTQDLRTTVPITTGWWETTTPLSEGTSTSKPTTIAWWETTPPPEKGSSSPKPTTIAWWETTTQGSSSNSNTIPTDQTWEITTSSNQINPTTTRPPVTTAMSQVILDCIKNCQPTPEYNPVCGTNNVTYENIGKLLCAKQCGVDVDLKRRSSCPSNGGDNAGSSTQITTMSPLVTSRTTSLNNFQKCMKLCAISSDYSPVCGTDLVTYINIERMNCAKGCGLEVQVLCDKPCPACGQGWQPTTTTTTVKSTWSWPSTTSEDLVRTTPSMSRERCLKTCPISKCGQSPVCGTNNVTYENPGHLLCAQYCGEDVKIFRFERCSSNRHDEDRQSCLRRCPITSEFSPICGTDGVTYTNPSRLACAIQCGVDVMFRADRPCSVLLDPTTTSSSITSMSPNKDTSSTTWSTPTTHAFKTPSSTVSTTPMSPTTSNRPPFTSPTSKPTPAVDFTIPPEILSSIFGDYTSEPTTKPTSITTADDEDFSIDPRFGNDDKENN